MKVIKEMTEVEYTTILFLWFYYFLIYVLKETLMLLDLCKHTTHLNNVWQLFEMKNYMIKEWEILLQDY